MQCHKGNFETLFICQDLNINKKNHPEDGTVFFCKSQVALLYELE